MGARRGGGPFGSASWWALGIALLVGAVVLALIARNGSSPAQVKTGDFTATGPAGWLVRTSSPCNGRQVAAGIRLLLDLCSPGKDSSTIDVESAPLSVTLAQVVAQARKGLSAQQAAAGFGTAIPVSTATIDGEYAYELTSRDRKQGPGESLDVAVQHRGVTYDIIFSASPADFARDRPKVDAFLRSWRWVKK